MFKKLCAEKYDNIPFKIKTPFTFFKSTKSFTTKL